MRAKAQNGWKKITAAVRWDDPLIQCALSPGSQWKTGTQKAAVSSGMRYWFVWFLCWHEPTTTRVVILGSSENAVAMATRYDARLATDVRTRAGVFNWPAKFNRHLLSPPPPISIDISLSLIFFSNKVPSFTYNLKHSSINSTVGRKRRHGKKVATLPSLLFHFLISFCLSFPESVLRFLVR